MEIRAIDAFYGRGASGEALVEFPDGHTQIYPLKHGRAVIPALPRGTYKVTIRGGGKAFKTPVSLSKPQIAEFKVITWLDIAAVALFVTFFLVGLLVIGRPHLLRLPARAVRRPATAGRAHGSVGASRSHGGARFSCCTLAAGTGPGAGGRRAPRPRGPSRAGLLLHLVHADELEPGEERLPAARPLRLRRRRT